MPLTAANSLDIRKPPAATRVVVAMSGGVDSSVVAGLLKRQGYDVVGITLQLYDHGAAAGRKGACCAGRDIHDARRVAAQLGIPHYVLDYQARFQSKVIDRFAQSYAAGETPIPCVACNSDVKFADLLETARDLGADVLATGHYVASRALPGGGRGLYRAADVARDQSYFLFATTPAQLGILRFPLGNLPKAEVRALARDFGLPVAEKPDSQDICFVPSGKYGDVIERVAPAAAVPGDIRHIDGRFLGRHAGIIRYTIGQRRGLGLGGFGGEPIYVVALDAATATVLVGPRSALATQSVHLRDLNWIGDGAARNAAAEGLPLFVRVRSTRPPAAATLHIEGGDAWIAFAQDEDAVAPGQACVFYESDAPGARILGGGFIRATERRAARAPVRLPETVGI